MKLSLPSEDIWGSGGIDPCILTLSTRWKWSNSRPGRFTHGKRAFDAHWIGGWEGPRARLDSTEKRKIPCPCRELNTGRPVPSPGLYRLSYPGL
jgi:hypothetical protein